MKPGYTIDQYGSSKMSLIYVYNWKSLNEIGIVSYDKFYSHIPTENLVAVFKVKYKS